jgi:DNA processing protein
VLGVAAGGPLARTGEGSATLGPTTRVVAPEPDPYADERDAWAVLAAVDGLGPVAFAALLDRYATGRAILADAIEPGGVDRLGATAPRAREDGRSLPAPVPLAVARAIADASLQRERLLARLRALRVQVVTMEEPAYPPRLAEIAMPPHVLYVQGSIEALAAPQAVAVVGTRRPTTAGRTTAGRIATALVQVGATVVSGLAVGIDGAAHEAAVRAGGTTIAVIGGGHARLAPPGHRRLAEAIVASGGAVVSEHAPDTQPTHGTFPRRNRVISGLSLATVVVEAPARSGALITASWALEQGRGCFLVPGSIDAPASAGCLAFLREWPEAARLVAGVPQLLADLGLVDPGRAGATTVTSDPVVAGALVELGTTARALASQLLAGRVTVDELVAATDLPVATVLAALAMLERRGLVAGVHGRYRPAGPLLGVPAPRRPR